MFKNRYHAGGLLSEKLAELNLENISVLALPRGGVIVAEPVAKKLKTGIKLLIVRKIGHPLNPEVAIGAMMPDGSTIVDDYLVSRWGITHEKLQDVIQVEKDELERRKSKYLGIVQREDVEGKNIIIIDDGIATGYSITAGIKWLKTLSPAKIIIGVPVAPEDTISELADIVDIVICLLKPKDFMAVGAFYEDFSETADKEVLAVLRHF